MEFVVARKLKLPLEIHVSFYYNEIKILLETVIIYIKYVQLRRY